MTNSSIFKQIIDSKIPATKVYEDDLVLAFHDINPQAPIHILIVPRQEYTDYQDFITRSAPEQIVRFFTKIKEIIEQQQLGHNFRLVTNAGIQCGQSVFHFHMHLLSGKSLGSFA